MQTTRTLEETAKLADRYGWRWATSDQALTVLGHINGFVAYEKGLTSDKHFLDPADAAAITVIDHGSVRR